ncbi:MAG: flavodoxin family protein [Planctomycetota bacterium]
MARIIVVYHSENGHTRLVAETIVRAMQESLGPNGSAELGNAEDAALRVSELEAADMIVFGTPTYMGGPSATFKAFAEATSRTWVQRRWVGKLAAGFTNSGGLHGDKQTTLFYLVTLAAQHGMVWVPLVEMAPDRTNDHGGKPDDINRVGASIGLMTQSDRTAPGHAPSPGDLATASRFGHHLAKTALRLLGGGARGELVSSS